MRVIMAAVISLLLATSSAHAQHGFWRPDERVLITSFLNARGIATDHRHVWVATDNGLEIYDAVFKRWLPPSTQEDGYPVTAGPGPIAYDPRERVLWLMTAALGAFTWSPTMESWEPRSNAEIPARVRERLMRRPDNSDIAWRVMRNTIARDPYGRPLQITDLESGEQSGTFWVALFGGNFAFADSRNLSSEPYVFGSISRGVSAIALDHSGHLYFGGDGASARNGIARADTSLQRWQHYESGVAAEPRRRINDIVATRDAVYAGSDDGLFVLRSGRWQRLADTSVRALASSRSRLWVGGRGTLGWVDSAGGYTRADFPPQSITGLAARDDTLWVATATAIHVLVTDRPAMSYELAASAIAATPDRVIALTTRGVVTLTAAGWSDVPRNASLAAIGRLTSVHAGDARVWFGGSYGVAEWNTSNDTWRYLTVPADIPEGPVYDVVYENGRLWLATPAGALRLQWK